MAIFAKRYFTDEAAAFTHLEGVLWPYGVVCPHCGTVDRAGKLKGVKAKNGKVRPGLWKCYSCLEAVRRSASAPFSRRPISRCRRGP